MRRGWRISKRAGQCRLVDLSQRCFAIAELRAYNRALLVAMFVGKLVDRHGRWLSTLRARRADIRGLKIVVVWLLHKLFPYPALQGF